MLSNPPLQTGEAFIDERRTDFRRPNRRDAERRNLPMTTPEHLPHRYIETTTDTPGFNTEDELEEMAGCSRHGIGRRWRVVFYQKENDGNLSSRSPTFQDVAIHR